MRREGNFLVFNKSQTDSCKEAPSKDASSAENIDFHQEFSVQGWYLVEETRVI